jgi:hypothetical protein
LHRIGVLEAVEPEPVRNCAVELLVQALGKAVRGPTGVAARQKRHTFAGVANRIVGGRHQKKAGLKDAPLNLGRRTAADEAGARGLDAAIVGAGAGPASRDQRDDAL